ncbi:MAG: flagellar basal-body rod protein FlgF [Variibacter sp.]|jgi:flagellar basal-body rod protein FlgF/flagellar basal-body rod protein FlgG|nr:flagellar basal-body rod protein FlgF [Variibacter sp.]
MENARLIGLSRQAALTRELAVIANNIANLNTSGFKVEGVSFQEFLSGGSNDSSSGSNRRLSFVVDGATWHDHRSGAIERTGNPLDVAIDGNAFLVVQGADGERYTRSGALQISANGELVDAAGKPVLGEGGPIVLQRQDRNINIARDGTVSVGDQTRGKLRLVEFAERERLTKEGANNFRAPAGVTPQPSTTSALAQGAIEKSNVNSVLEMTRMIEVTRAYTHIAQLGQQQSELRSKAVDRLAEVPA